MTKEEIAKLESDTIDELTKGNAKIEADRIIIEFLEYLGHTEVFDAYWNIQIASKLEIF